MDIRMSNTATPMPQIRARFTSKLGIPLSGCKVYTYEPNSNIPKTTWVDIDKTAENTNPILLDAAGEADIFLNGLYQIVVKDRFGFVVYDVEKTGSTQQAINDFGGAEWWDKPGGYRLGSTVKLANGDIVRSTIPNNTNNPNVNMTGWSNPKDTLIHTVATLSDLTDRNGKNGDVVYVLENKKQYLYDSSLSAASNGVTIIGKWEMEVQDAYYASWFAQSEVILDQSDSLQSAWDYATLKKSNFVFDRIFYVSQKNHTYPDGLVRKIGLQVPNNSTTYFTDNASIKLIPNAEPLGYVVNFYLAENFKIYNPVVYGDVDEHTGGGESNHCFNIVNCKNGFVFRPKAYNAWGDGIYIGTEYSSATLKQIENVTVFEPYAEHCGRDCISITSGKDVKIYSPTVKDAFRVAPKAGINIESEGIGLTKSEFINLQIIGTVTAENCAAALAVQLYDSLNSDASITVEDVVSKNCLGGVFTQLFSEKSGFVNIGNVHATAWVASAVRVNWLQLNCQLNIGDVHSINANCSGTVQRFSSVISIDIDAENQPLVNIGNFSIGDIYIKDTATTKVMHPLYFKDNTTAADGARKLNKCKIGSIYGTTLNTVFYADGHVTSNFKFDLEYITPYYLPPSRPYLYTKLKSLAIGFDPFTLTVSSSYKTPLTVQKYATGTTPLRVILPSGSTINPPALGGNSGLETTVSGSSISIEWSGSDAFITSSVGTWNPY